MWSFLLVWRKRRHVADQAAGAAAMTRSNARRDAARAWIIAQHCVLDLGGRSKLSHEPAIDFLRFRGIDQFGRSLGNVAARRDSGARTSKPGRQRLIRSNVVVVWHSGQLECLRDRTEAEYDPENVKRFPNRSSANNCLERDDAPFQSLRA